MGPDGVWAFTLLCRRVSLLSGESHFDFKVGVAELFVGQLKKWPRRGDCSDCPDHTSMGCSGGATEKVCRITKEIYGGMHSNDRLER